MTINVLSHEFSLLTCSKPSAELPREGIEQSDTTLLADLFGHHFTFLVSSVVRKKFAKVFKRNEGRVQGT